MTANIVIISVYCSSEWYECVD